MEGVKFIRVRGRIVPIRNKKRLSNDEIVKERHAQKSKALKMATVSGVSSASGFVFTREKMLGLIKKGVPGRNALSIARNSKAASIAVVGGAALQLASTFPLFKSSKLDMSLPKEKREGFLSRTATAAAILFAAPALGASATIGGYKMLIKHGSKFGKAVKAARMARGYAR